MIVYHILLLIKFTDRHFDTFLTVNFIAQKLSQLNDVIEIQIVRPYLINIIKLQHEVK